MRSFLSITGDDRVSFLQGLVTVDVTKLAEEKIQFAAMLSPQGKILHDMFLIHTPDAILIDTQTADAEALRKRLGLYKLRAKVSIVDGLMTRLSAMPDPRHPNLPPRDYTDPRILGTSDPLQLGIPELGRDFLPDQLTALDAGYDLLHAVSFTKGCYVGQEVTARMHYKQIARKGFFMLTPVEGGLSRLVVLKFEEVGAPEAEIIHEGARCRALLPGWMRPRFEQWQHQHAQP